MRAQRASAPVRLARGAALVLIAGLAVVIAVRLAGRRDAGPAPEPAEPPPAGRVDVEERVRHQEFKDGRTVVDLRADSFSLGADGRNHLAGSVEIVSSGPAGDIVSRLRADEVVYAPGSLKFVITGHVRVEAGDLVLEGGSFEYDKAAGLFGTTGGGRFKSRTTSGEAPEISYRESDREVRLGGGFRLELPESSGAGPGRRTMTVSGGSLVLGRSERRGRIDGRASIEGAGLRAASQTAAFVVSADESSLESMVLEGSPEVVLVPEDASEEGNGEVRGDRVAVSFSRDPAGLALRASGRSALSFRSAADKTEKVQAPEIVLNVVRGEGRGTWSASGGIRAEIAEGGAVRRAVEGEAAAFDGAKVITVTGAPGRPAVADSAEARIEAPRIAVASATGDVLASGGVACLLKRSESRRAVGFFSPAEDVSVSSGQVDLRSQNSVTLFTLFTGNVVARQGENAVRAGEIETAGDAGRMTGRDGVEIRLTEPPSGGRAGRTIALSGQDMTFRPDLRSLVLSPRASVKLPEASLEAAAVTAVIGRDGRTVESLSASGSVTVSHGRYSGRSEAASYEAKTGRLTLTGKPVLTDDKGGSARGAKLTFSLTDDKIFIENEGPGRAATVVRS